MLRILESDGSVVGELPELTDDAMVALYRHMVETRALDERALHLQRTGRLPAYYQCSGQEAHVAAAHALEDTDWIVIAYREQGIRRARGVTAVEELSLFTGTPGAQWNPLERRVTPLTATIGTHIPHATGLSYAQSLADDGAITMAVFGDGATSEADFHAGLNFAGVWRTPTIFFCQNNQYAQSTPLAKQTASESLAAKAIAYGIPGVQVDGMDPLAVYAAVAEAAERARSGGGATLIEAVMYRYSAHSTYDGVPVYRTRDEEAVWKARDPLIRMGVFLTDRGLIDAHTEGALRTATEAEVDDAIAVLEAWPAVDRTFNTGEMYTETPRHLVEQIAAESSATGESASLQASGGGEVDDGGGESTEMTLVEAIGSALEAGMERDGRVVVLGEDVAVEGGVFRVTDGLLDRFGADRVIDTPLSETGIAGTSVGMALGGLRPVAEIEFAGFVGTAFDQITFHVARYRWRTRGAFAMPIVVRMPTGGGHGGLEGHSDTNEAWFIHTPGLSVAYPSNPADAKGLLTTALDMDDPVLFYEPIAQYFVRSGGVPVGEHRIPFGSARIARQGSDATIVTYGNPVHTSLDAAGVLAERGVDVEVVDLRTLKPWDVDAVIDSVGRTGRLVVVHEAPLIGGFGAEIVATITERAGFLLETPPVRVGHADAVWGPTMLEPWSMITPDRIADAVDRVLRD